jgi:hypothetical protein
VTPRNIRPGYGRSAGPVALVAATALLGVTGAVLAVRGDAGVVALLGDVLSGAGVVGIGLVLVAALSAARVVRAQAQQNLAAARRAEAVAADLREEVLRLQCDIARLAVRVETSHRRKREDTTDDHRPGPVTGS